MQHTWVRVCSFGFSFFFLLFFFSLLSIVQKRSFEHFELWFPILPFFIHFNFICRLPLPLLLLLFHFTKKERWANAYVVCDMIWPTACTTIAQHYRNTHFIRVQLFFRFIFVFSSSQSQVVDISLSFISFWYNFIVSVWKRLRCFVASIRREYIRYT